MLHKAWSSIEEVPYCFWRSSVKFQGHTALKIIKFDPNWVFPDCNSSLNSPMAMKCCAKLETAKERCPIVFQGHPSNFKVTRYKTSPILTQIGHFPTVGRSQLSNPSDLPCLYFRLHYFFIYSLWEEIMMLDLSLSVQTWHHTEFSGGKKVPGMKSPSSDRQSKINRCRSWVNQGQSNSVPIPPPDRCHLQSIAYMPRHI